MSRFTRGAVPIVLSLLTWPGAESLLTAADPPVRADFYVATVGRDVDPGTLENPLATLARARDPIRQLKPKRLANAGVVVLIRAGTYFLKEPVVFGPADSGTADRRIVYAAFPRETPVFSGGRAIAG